MLWFIYQFNLPVFLYSGPLLHVTYLVFFVTASVHSSFHPSIHEYIHLYVYPGLPSIAELLGLEERLYRISAELCQQQTLKFRS